MRTPVQKKRLKACPHFSQDISGTKRDKIISKKSVEHLTKLRIKYAITEQLKK